MENEILGNLKMAIKRYDRDGAASWAKKAVEAKIDTIKTFNAMTEVMREVGDDYERGKLWLPDLVGAADAMQSATPILDEEIKRIGAKKQTVATVVAGTVFGDIHSIGITMVCTLLVAAGFDVHMLGINITAEQFIEAIKKHKADILAMSSLLTLTATEQKKVVDALKKEGMRDKVKVMVGGGSISADFAQNIGADGYAPTAPGAVELAKKLIDAG